MSFWPPANRIEKIDHVGRLVVSGAISMMVVKSKRSSGYFYLEPEFDYSSSFEIQGDFELFVLPRFSADFIREVKNSGYDNLSLSDRQWAARYSVLAQRMDEAGLESGLYFKDNPSIAVSVLSHELLDFDVKVLGRR